MALFLAGLVVILFVAVFAIRRTGRSSKMIGSKGMSPARTCPDCGLPLARCRHLRRQAETARGMGQKK